MGGLPDPNSDCRKHPNHKQLPGVCSFCLRESLLKLTNIAAAADDDDDESNKTAYYSSLSSSPAYSSASSFSPAVVTTKAAVVERKPRQQHRKRNGSGSDDHSAAVPLGFLLNEGSSSSNGDLGLKKSRSMGCAPRISRGGNGIGNANSNGNGNGGERGNKKGPGKKSGFWKRLIHSTSKKTKGVLMHSSTMKERFNEMSTSSSTRRL